MNTNQIQTSSPRGESSRPGRTRATVVIAVVALCAIAATGAWLMSDDDTGGADAGFAVVKRGPLTISISQRGTIKSRDKVVVKCKVEGRNTIITLIEEGTMVKKGDLLLELDSSKLVERKDQQETSVSNAAANVERADGTLVITRNKSKADIAKAELDLKFADLDLAKYTKGDYPLQLEQAEKDIKLAREELERASAKVAGSKRLQSKGYITMTELKADELAEKRSDLNLIMANRKQNLLKTYTHERDLEQLKSNVIQATMALERTLIKASSDIKLAELDLKHKKGQHAKNTVYFNKIVEQIGYCRVVAPVAGQVVYATTGGRRHWRSPEPLDKGQEVRERQELFHLPTADAMMTEIKIHESKKDDVKVGMLARITINSKPGKVFTGRLAWIAPMSTKGDWTKPNVTAFNTEIHLDSNGEKISPGGSCQVEVILKEYTDVLSVPLQSVVKVKGRSTVYVKTGDGIEPRVVELGMDNGRVVHIKSGLKEGEKVSLTPPLEKATAGHGQVRTKPAPKKKPTSRPAEKPAGQTPDFSKMTPELKQKYMESLTDEQRAKLRGQMQRKGGRRGRRGGGSGRGD